MTPLTLRVSLWFVNSLCTELFYEGYKKSMNLDDFIHVERCVLSYLHRWKAKP